MTNTRCRFALVGLAIVLVFCSAVSATDLLISVLDSQDASPVSQARIYVDNTSIGQTTSSGTFLISHDKDTDFNLTLIKRGYEQWSAAVDPDLAFLEISLVPATHVLTVQVYDADSLSPVAGAVVRLSFSTDNVTAASDTNGVAAFPVAPDISYTITISAPGYRSTAGQVIGQSASQTAQYWLVRSDRISFTVADETGAGIEGATIYLDGERAGTTDRRGVLIHAVPRNVPYAIEVKKDGYQDFSESRTISEGEAVLPITMVRGESSEAASLTITVMDRDQKPVQGALLTLGSRVLGSSDGRGQVVASVPFDTPVTVTAQKDGYATTSATTAVITGNATAALAITLDPGPDWGFIALVLLGIGIIVAVVVGFRRRRRPARHIVRRNEI